MIGHLVARALNDKLPYGARTRHRRPDVNAGTQASRVLTAIRRGARTLRDIADETRLSDKHVAAYCGWLHQYRYIRKDGTWWLPFNAKRHKPRTRATVIAAIIATPTQHRSVYLPPKGSIALSLLYRGH